MGKKKKAGYGDIKFYWRQFKGRELDSLNLLSSADCLQPPPGIYWPINGCWCQSNASHHLSLPKSEQLRITPNWHTNLQAFHLSEPQSGTIDIKLSHFTSHTYLPQLHLSRRSKSEIILILKQCYQYKWDVLCGFIHARVDCSALFCLHLRYVFTLISSICCRC